MDLMVVLKLHLSWLNNESEGKRANLRDADLRGANLRGADLRGADLRGADLRGADLRDADLRDADLRGADLRDADLRDAELRGADLRDADLDFASWPLCCGSLGVKVDVKISAQLAYHFCRIECEDDEVKAAQEALRVLANKFHRVDECGEIESKK